MHACVQSIGKLLDSAVSHLPFFLLPSILPAHVAVRDFSRETSPWGVRSYKEQPLSKLKSILMYRGNYSAVED